MRIVPVLPPKDEFNLIAAELNRLMGVAKHLSIELDMQGFATSWSADTTRVFVATDTVDGVEHSVVGMSMMVFGRRFFDSNETATVLFCEGPARQQMLEYMKSMCPILGVRTLFYQQRDGDTIGGKPTTLTEVSI